nr:hypothetical protein [candidate division Zixibacteria bacterium]
MRTRNWKIGLVLLIVMAIPGLVSADTMMKQVARTEGFEMMGQKVEPTIDTSTTWIGSGRARTDQGDTMSVIMLADQNAMYMIDHQDSVYYEMPLDALGDISKMLDAESSGDEEAAAMAEMMKGMMAQMKITATVEPTEETKKIKVWNTKKYIVTMDMGMMKMTMDLWASDEIKVDYEMFNKLTHSMMAQFPGFQEAMEEMKKVKGVSVASDISINMMGNIIKASNEMLEVREGDAPAGTYTIPEGYTKQEGLPGME